MKSHLVRDPSARNHFTMIPNIVTKMSELSHAATRLYLWYKMVCGEKEDGECYQSISTVGKGCSMGRQTVVNSRRELEKYGLVKMTKEKVADGYDKVIVTIIDVWKRNEEVVQTRDGTGQNEILAPVQSRYTNKNPANKKEKKEGRQSSSHKTNGFLPTNWDREAGKRLLSIFKEHDNDLQRSLPNTLAKEICRLRTRKVSKERIKAFIKWYKDHYEDEFTPKMYKVNDVSTKFKRCEDAMKRTSNGDRESSLQSSSGLSDFEKLVFLVKSFLCKEGTYNPDMITMQADVDRALVELGHKPGDVHSSYV